MTTSPRKRFVIIGTGSRSRMYLDALSKKYTETSELVGLCDQNPGRLAFTAEVYAKHFPDIPTYPAEEFERMIKETRPDEVIVTTKDSSHDEYIVRAMELGCDAITEKPMTTDAEKCQRILDTEAKTGRRCRVTFNYRYSPPRTQVKDLLMSGVIGDVLAVDFQWLLDTYHGADYFRRWHRNKENSGGLLVHKATHHFDLVNWWLSSVPEEVYATGHRRFATLDMAERLGLSNRGERCWDCAEKERCTFKLDLAGNQKLQNLYRNHEEHDGYFRDRCIFAPDIDIEDSMNVLVHYRNQVKLNYSLHVFSAWEGYQIAFHGTKGRIEHKCNETVYISGDGSVQGELKKEGTHTRVFPLRETPYEVDLWEAKGGHGGGDDPLLNDLFGEPTEDPYLRAADHRSGAYSILCGIAGNASMASGRSIRIDDLVSGLSEPDYPPMPDPTAPLPMPRQIK
ncbi:MAG: Gfo/Idh/MocA family oxidoreductase [Opitutales bacterium]|nr:Gfo/Idh/MocA family oxidoreductase [Opitutales bacterium]